MDDAADARLRRRERRVDEQLRELAEMRGLANLPGEGVPLVDDDGGAGDAWAARHIAKNANVTSFRATAVTVTLWGFRFRSLRKNAPIGPG